MTDKERVMRHLKVAQSSLISAKIGISEENGPGKQWDYVNDPTLSDAVDQVKKLSDQINSFVYQEI